MGLKQMYNNLGQNRSQARIKALLLTIIALIVFTYLWVTSNENYKQKIHNEQVSHISDELRSCSVTLSDVLNQRFALLNGLEAFAQTQLKNGQGFANYDCFASVLYSAVPGIRNLIIAPGGINQYVYPLASNEAAVGHNLINDERPDVRQDVQTAISTGRAVISGPYELRQKGQGMILRKAIYYQGQFWGLVTMAVDMEPIYTTAGLTANDRMMLALRKNKEIVYGQADVFAAKPVIQTIEWPNGSALELAAIPVGGWEQSIETRLTLYRLFTLAILVLLLIIIYLVSYRNAKIKMLVDDKTKELHLAKTRLEEELQVSVRLENELRESNEYLKYLSLYDHLTGLYNRAYFEKALKSYDREENLPLTIVFADINGLKLVNYTFGHSAGDNLLRKTAQILKEEFRADDMIARTGGDEFVILLGQTKMEEVDRIAKRIKGKISSMKEEAIQLSISLGWETKKKAAEDLDEILKKAENNMYRQKLFEYPSMRGETINAILNTLHEKNKREETHSRRVSKICEAMGEALNLTDKEINELKTVGLLHDIGKVAIEERILNKTGKLSEKEWLEIKRHPEIGYRILSSVNDMSDLAEYVLAHHERWDGKGYPKGLRGEEIPLQARIIAIADAYDAMTSERSYREPLPEQIAIEELQKHSHTQFDSRLTKIFIEKILNKNGPSFGVESNAGNI